MTLLYTCLFTFLFSFSLLFLSIIIWVHCAGSGKLVLITAVYVHFFFRTDGVF